MENAIALAESLNIACGVLRKGLVVQCLSVNLASEMAEVLPIVSAQWAVHKGIFIGGDPKGLRSLVALLNWLADVDQEANPNLPAGEREHTHLYCGSQLTPQSADTEVCRLDVKRTGEAPEYPARAKRIKK